MTTPGATHRQIAPAPHILPTPHTMPAREPDETRVQGTIRRRNPQDELEPWHRLGVTVALLESFIRTRNIGEKMTSGEVCELVIKPYFALLSASLALRLCEALQSLLQISTLAISCGVGKA